MLPIITLFSIILSLSNGIDIIPGTTYNKLSSGSSSALTVTFPAHSEQQISLQFRDNVASAMIVASGDYGAWSPATWWWENPNNYSYVRNCPNTTIEGINTVSFSTPIVDGFVIYLLTLRMNQLNPTILVGSYNATYATYTDARMPYVKLDLTGETAGTFRIFFFVSRSTTKNVTISRGAGCRNDQSQLLSNGQAMNIDITDTSIPIWISIIQTLNEDKYTYGFGYCKGATCEVGSNPLAQTTPPSTIFPPHSLNTAIYQQNSLAIKEGPLGIFVFILPILTFLLTSI